MLNDLKSQLQSTIQRCLADSYPPSTPVPPLELEVPNEREHGEFATNIALKSAKILRRPPLEIAAQMVPVITEGIRQSSLRTKIERVEVKAPGFINFYISREAVYDVLREVFDKQEAYGAAATGRGVKVQLEFVSANPTGPLSVAHARQAAVGDALGNILSFLGCEAVKEFYVNDEGNQINLLGESVRIQAQKLLTG